MTGWHLDEDTLRRYVERTDSLTEGVSAEHHLLSCEPWRGRSQRLRDFTPQRHRVQGGALVRRPV